MAEQDALAPLLALADAATKAKAIAAEAAKLMNDAKMAKIGAASRKFEGGQASIAQMGALAQAARSSSAIMASPLRRSAERPSMYWRSPTAA